MTSNLDDVPREDAPAVPPGTDGDDDRPVADEPIEPDRPAPPDPDRVVPDA